MRDHSVRMPGDPHHNAEMFPITEVERQTGIRQATLRIWEKRYGFPQPLRDRHGDRVYPASQVERLHAVRRLIDQGVRPGKIFGSAPPADAAAADRVALDAHAAVPEQFQRVFSLLRDYRLPELHGLFQHRLLDMGMRRFIIEFLAPLSTEVGLAWSRGVLPVRCEHLFGQLAMSVLHARQAAIRVAADGRPKVVLATLAGETHALGIMMVEAVLASFEMDCFQLGTDTPPLEVAAAARETAADIVALSFSSYFSRKSMVRMLTSLRTALPPSTALWVGGEGVRGAETALAGIDVFTSLQSIQPALDRWRLQRGAKSILRPPNWDGQ